MPQIGLQIHHSQLYMFFMQSTAELIWHGREQPLIFLDSLKEAHLFFLEGMTNGMDAKLSI